MVVYPVMGQPSCYPTTQATPPPLNIASSAVSIFKRWMNQTANNIYCKAMLAQWHICQTSYFIMKDFLQNCTLHRATDHCESPLLCDQPASTIATLCLEHLGGHSAGGGSALQPHSFSSSLCCAEGRRAQPHKSLHYGSGTRALLHYGFHIRAFIRALSHSNELCFAVLQSLWLGLCRGPA